MPTTSPVVSAAPLPGLPFWNDTPFRTYLFDAFSVVIPAGESFIVDAVAQAAADPAVDAALRREAARFIDEEKSHQRAHAVYNQRLAEAGHDVHRLQRRIESDLAMFNARLGVVQRLCIAAAFEQITSVLSRAALEQPGWLSAHDSREARLWRWHCAEEVAHAHVTLKLMRALRVPGWQRLAFYLAASLLLMSDIVGQVLDFRRADRRRAPGRLPPFWPSVFEFVSRGARWGRVAADWLRYFLPLDRLTPSVAALLARFLRRDDIPALLELEHRKWEAGQAADGDDMAARIQRHPRLSFGVFDVQTGQALASLFMKPTSRELVLQSANWQECVASDPADDAGGEPALFGISLSSARPDAADALFEFFWPHALKDGWRHIYLGSPIPGFDRWMAAHPTSSVYRYVHSRQLSRETRRLLPRDPQLRYYSQRGFRHIEYIRQDYFPHEGSRNFGVVIRGTVPLSVAAPLWRRLPLAWLRALRKALFLLI